MITFLLCRIPVNDAHTNVRQQRKVIVFLNQLTLLFKHCHICHATEPALTVKQAGTMIVITSTCLECNQQFTWKSQPHMLDSKYFAGDVLLSFATLCAGGSIRKTLLIFEHMGICAYHESSYYRHQRKLFFSSIITHWRSYQDKIFKSVDGKEVVLAGDGRHDSMGHSAKFGTYTIFCCSVGLILHLVVIQVRMLYFFS